MYVAEKIIAQTHQCLWAIPMSVVADRDVVVIVDVVNVLVVTGNGCCATARHIVQIDERYRICEVRDSFRHGLSRQ